MLGSPDFLTDRDLNQPAEFQELETPEGELHLRFYVASTHEFALPAIGIREVLSQPIERITPIPNTSPLLLGTLNLRGRVIWVADLGQFLGETSALNTDRPEIPVIAVEDQETLLGLAVDRIVGMEWLNGDALEMSTHSSDSMAPFLRGEWVLDRGAGQFLRLLDQVSILRSARWAA